MKENKLSLISVAFIALVFIISPLLTDNISATNSCEDIQVLFARGSGQEQDNSLTDIEKNTEYKKFSNELISKLSEKTTYNSYSLDYPAVSIAGLDKSLEQIRNGTSAEFEYAEDSFGGEYRNSVQAGEDEAIRQIEDIAIQCYEEGTKIVIGGYSQGAHVIGSALFRLSPAAREMIVYVGLFGDPKFKPDSYAVRGNFANSSGGILEARDLEFPDGFRGKVESWCLNGDGICEDNMATAVFGNHGNYTDRAIPSAASKAYVNYKRAQLGIAFSEYDGMPEFKDNLTDQQRLTLQQQPEDVVIIADASPSMRPNWFYAHKSLGKFFRDDVVGLNHVGLTLYQSEQRNYMTRQGFDLTNEGVRNSFKQLAGSDGNINEHDPMNMFAGIKAALHHQDWRSRAKKKLLIVGDSPVKASKDEYSAIKDFAIENNIQINIVMKFSYYHSQEMLSKLEGLAINTGGQFRVISSYYPKFAHRVANVLRDSFSTPVVNSVNSYKTFVDKPLLMHVGSSYDIDNHIIQYEWDFEGDGEYDQITYHPTVINTYNHSGEFDTVVRATAADGGTGVGSFKVEVLPAEKAPIFPTVTDAELIKVDDRYMLSWKQPVSREPIGYSIYRDDDSLIGVVPGDEQSSVINSDQAIDELIIETNYPEGSSERVRVPFEIEDDIGNSNDKDEGNEEESTGGAEEGGEETNNTKPEGRESSQDSDDANDNNEEQKDKEEPSDQTEDNPDKKEDQNEDDNQADTEDPMKDTEENDEEPIDDESKDSTDQNQDQTNDDTQENEEDSNNDTQTDESQETGSIEDETGSDNEEQEDNDSTSNQEDATDTSDSNNTNNSSSDSNTEDAISEPEGSGNDSVIDEPDSEDSFTASTTSGGISEDAINEEPEAGAVLGANDKAGDAATSHNYSRVLPMIIIFLTATISASVYRRRNKE